MSHTLNSIEPFLAFLDMNPKHMFDVSEGKHCAYAQYLRSCGMRHPNVSDDTAVFDDATNEQVVLKLPRELGTLHCERAARGSENPWLSYATLAERIRTRIQVMKSRDEFFTSVGLPVTVKEHACIA